MIKIKRGTTIFILDGRSSQATTAKSDMTVKVTAEDRFYYSFKIGVITYSVDKAYVEFVNE